MAAMASAGNNSRSLALLPVLLALAGAIVFFLLLAPAAAAADAEAAAAPPLQQGLEFHVGGPRGWRVPDANTSYGWWAMNNRFRVGDRLYFKYANDSVLLVDRSAFDGCNTTEPLATFADGATRFVLDRPGFFCFISGEPGHCEEGQRLIVRVMVHSPAATTGATTPAYAPAMYPGHGGGGEGHPPRASSSGADSAAFAGADAGVAVAAAAMAVFVSLVVLMLH